MPKINKQAIMVAILIGCVVVVAFWEVMAYRSKQPWASFHLGSADFEGFRPGDSICSARALDIGPDHPSVPNLWAYETSLGDGGMSILVRLAHGYNMVDCMKLKGYEVELISDIGGQEDSSAGISESPLDSELLIPNLSTLPRVQTWRLTSDIGDRSVWVTSILHASDFRGADIDVRSMAFPRVVSGEDARWDPEGLSFSSLRHPIRNFRRYIRKKWNNARCDLPTFLALRQPAWASDEVMTLVSKSSGRISSDVNEQAIIDQVTAAHTFMHGKLCDWHRSRTQGEPADRLR